MVRNRYFDIVELLVQGVSGGNTQTTFNFPDQPQLRSTPILSIVAYTPDICTNSGITFQPLVSVANMKNAYLTLFTTDPQSKVQKNGINRIPLLELNYIDDGAGSPRVIYMPEFVGQTIVWPKSFITLAAAVGNTTNEVFQLGVRYEDSVNVQQ